MAKKRRLTLRLLNRGGEEPAKRPRCQAEEIWKDRFKGELKNFNITRGSKTRTRKIGGGTDGKRARGKSKRKDTVKNPL